MRCWAALSCQINVIADHQFGIHTLTHSGVERGALPSPARPKRKSHATEGTRLHRPWAVSFLTLYHVFNTYPFAPHHAHTQFGCHAVSPPRASKLSLPSCSTDLGSLLSLSSVPQSKPEKNSQQLALLYSGLSKVSPTNNCQVSNTQSQTPIRQRHNMAWQLSCQIIVIDWSPIWYTHTTPLIHGTHWLTRNIRWILENWMKWRCGCQIVGMSDEPSMTI